MRAFISHSAYTGGDSIFEKPWGAYLWFANTRKERRASTRHVVSTRPTSTIGLPGYQPRRTSGTRRSWSLGKRQAATTIPALIAAKAWQQLSCVQNWCSGSKLCFRLQLRTILVAPSRSVLITNRQMAITRGLASGHPETGTACYCWRRTWHYV